MSLKIKIKKETWGRSRLKGKITSSSVQSLGIYKKS